MNAIIYTRVSTLEQSAEGYSLSAQEKILREWCNQRGYTVAGVYCDAGISAKDLKHRPAMLDMMSRVKRGDIDVICVHSLSRLTRSVPDLYSTLEVLRKYNTSLYSHTEVLDTSTPTGRAMVGMLGVFAQLERELTGERVRTAMAERASRGKPTCSSVLGYDLVCGNMTINEEEAARVKFIYAAYLQHKNLSKVARLCDEKGYRGKRGKVFRAENIKKILTRPIYIGHYSYMGQSYPGNFDPIINKQTFADIQRLLNQ